MLNAYKNFAKERKTRKEIFFWKVGQFSALEQKSKGNDDSTSLALTFCTEVKS